MTCDRYWRDGIVLVERGLEDPHRHGCTDCRYAHAARQELIDCLPLVGAGRTGDPGWQAKVWQRIDGEQDRVPRRWRWQIGGALAAACVVALWFAVGRERSERPDVTVIAQGEVKRANDAHVDDRLRVRVGKTSAVWIYCAGRLISHCWPGDASEACTPDSQGMVAEIPLSVRGNYDVLVIDVPVAPPVGKLDTDLAALKRAGVDPFMTRIPVH